LWTNAKILPAIAFFAISTKTQPIVNQLVGKVIDRKDADIPKLRTAKV
jgi:hypothetical protein